MLRSILLIAFSLFSLAAILSPEGILRVELGVEALYKQVALHLFCLLASLPLFFNAQHALNNSLSAGVGVEILISWSSICLQFALIVSFILHFQVWRENLSALESYEDATVSFVGGSIVIEGMLGRNSGKDVVLKIENLHTSSLAITSSGGLIDTALKIAAAVKEKALTVHVRDYCASACVIIASASPHLTANRNAVFGFHRGAALTSSEDSLSRFISKKATEQLVSALRANGIPEDILLVASSTPPQDMHHVSAVELERRGVIVRLTE